MDRQWRRPHRRERGPSLTSVASAAVIAYGTYRLASWAWNSRYEDTTEEEENERQQHELPASNEYVVRRPQTPHQWRTRRQRMGRCREEATKAMHGLLPTLRKTIEERTSTSKEAQSLKQLRAQRDEQLINREAEKDLWDTIKVRAVTRMVATAYAHSILFLVVTVQVNLLGGKLFEEQLKTTLSSESSNDMESVASDRMEAYSESHKLVLQHTYKYFFDQGIDCLIASVERAVRNAMQNWNVSDASSLNISKESFDQAINDIRAVEEQGRVTSRLKRPRSLLRFLMPRSETLDETVSDELARWILDETWDLLESPVLMDAQSDCLDCTFARMRDHYWGKMFDVEDPDLPRHAANRSVTKPLAHVVTRLKYTSKSFVKNQQQSPGGMDDFLPVSLSQRFAANDYCAAMEVLPSVLELADVSFN